MTITSGNHYADFSRNTVRIERRDALVDMLSSNAGINGATMPQHRSTRAKQSGAVKDKYRNDSVRRLCVLCVFSLPDALCKESLTLVIVYLSISEQYFHMTNIHRAYVWDC